MAGLIHLTQEPRRSVVGRPPVLLMLHGIGSHEGDLIGLAPYVDPRLFVVSPRGPITFPPGYAWFRTAFTEHGPVINAEDAERSRQTLLHFIDEIVAQYDLDPQRVYLLGFSQGAIMSLSLVLTAPEILAGAAAMSGRVLPEVLPHTVAPERLTGLPVLVVHGEFDQLLPVEQFGRFTRDVLADLPVALTYREYPMGHQVSEQSLSDVTRWLTERLDGPRREENEESGRRP